MLSQSRTAAQTRPNPAGPVRHRRPQPRVAGTRVARSGPPPQSCSDEVTGLQKSPHTNQKPPTFTDVKSCGSRTHRAPARTDKKKNKNKQKTNKKVTWTRLKDSTVSKTDLKKSPRGFEEAVKAAQPLFRGHPPSALQAARRLSWRLIARAGFPN